MTRRSLPITQLRGGHYFVVYYSITRGRAGVETCATCGHRNTPTQEHRNTGTRDTGNTPGHTTTRINRYTGTNGNVCVRDNRDVPQEHGNTGTRGGTNAGAHEAHESTNARSPVTYNSFSCFFSGVAKKYIERP